MIITSIANVTEDLEPLNSYVLNDELKNIVANIKQVKEAKKSYDDLSEQEKDLLYVIDDAMHFTFVCAVLYIDNNVKEASNYTGIPEKSIELFRDIFFDVKKFRGKLAKTALFKSLIESEDTYKKDFGNILKWAYVLGMDYILWKYGLTTAQTDVTDIANNTYRDMYYRYVEESLKNVDTQTLLKNGKLLISAASDIIRTSNMGSANVGDEIKQYLFELSKGSDEEVELEFIDIMEENNINELENNDNE